MHLVCEGHPQIAWLTPGMQLVQTRPSVTPEPIVRPDTDADGSAAQLWGTVLRDGGRFRMWYAAFPRVWDGSDSAARVACAESDDGLTWRKPAYGVLEHAGSKDNHLTDLPFLAASVFIDPTAPAAQRYRAFGWLHGPAGWFTHTAHSPDGLRWTVEGPVYESSDGVWSTWDPFSNSALLMVENTRYVSGIPRRVWYSSTWTRDGGATPQVSALVPDEFDDVTAIARGFRSADYYGLGVMHTPGARVGFLWVFRHNLPYLSATRNQTGNWGRIDLALAYQLERGGRWRHFPGRPDWVCADDMPHWARGCLYTASSPIDVGDETWLYFGGDAHRHAWFLGYDWKKPGDPRLRSLQEPGGFCAVGLMRWPKHRLMGYHAPLLEKLELVARPAAGPGRLVLNALTRPNGSVRVALAEKPGGKVIEGYDFADGEPLVGDCRDVAVRWRGRPDLPPAGRAGLFLAGHRLCAQIEIVKATLYAFDFTAPADENAPRGITRAGEPFG